MLVLVSMSPYLDLERKLLTPRDAQLKSAPLLDRQRNLARKQHNLTKQPKPKPHELITQLKPQQAPIT